MLHQATVNVRASRVEVTPPGVPIHTGGYAPDLQASKIDSGLEFSVVLIEGDNDAKVAICSLDGLYFTWPLREAVLKVLASVGYTAADVITAATHTHYAPMIDETKWRLGTMETSYAGYLSTAVSAACRQALSMPPRAAEMSLGNYRFGLGVNRRKLSHYWGKRPHFTPRAVLRPNYEGLVDDQVVVASFTDDSGPIATVWEAACHPTSYPDPLVITAHFPGDVRKRLRSVFGDPELPVAFLQGFSGNIRPLATARSSSVTKRMIRRFGLERFANFSDADYRNWVNSAADAVEMASEKSVPESASLVRSARIEVNPIAGLGRPSDRVGFQAIAIGELVVIGASAELVAEYAPVVRSLFPGKTVMCVGCLDGVSGYWPTTAMLEEGGYEVEGHCKLFDTLPAQPSAEPWIIEQFCSLADQIN